MNRITVALVGQPNTGKSTIFNMLTGARQHVANYPRITVEKRTGGYAYGDDRVEVIDLPGTYSLSSYSSEEKVTGSYLLHEKPDVVLNIVDAANLERNLYLTFQLAETGLPTIVILNMIDVATRHGLSIDCERLEHALGLEVVPSIGKKRESIDNIREAVSRTHKDRLRDGDTGGHRVGVPFRLDYGHELEFFLGPLEERLGKNRALDAYSVRWLAVKLLENDDEVRGFVHEKETAA